MRSGVDMDSVCLRGVFSRRGAPSCFPKHGGSLPVAVRTRRMTHGGGPLRAATRAGSPLRLGKEHCLSDLSSFSLFSKKPKETAVGRTPDRGDGTSPGVRLAASKHAFIRHHPAVLQVLGLVHESRNTAFSVRGASQREFRAFHESRNTARITAFTYRHHIDATTLLGRASTQRRDKK